MFDKKFLNEVINSLGTKPKRNSRVLIVDSMNTFMRSFASINKLNPRGNHIGGLSGYLRSIGYVIRMFRPTRVILVFDGGGSTTNKKNLFPDYKGNRNIKRITNWEIFDNKEEENEAMGNQMSRLIQYLRQLPVTLISVDKIEADDSIGFITSYFEKDSDCENITILSADKDFYQLISKKTSVYSPTKKKLYRIKEVMDEYGVHPNNFLIYKTLLGDTSDNIPGITGLGPKKIIKMFPVSDETEYDINFIINYCKENNRAKTMYGNVLEMEKQLKLNYQLMNIRIPNISEEDKLYILNLINEEINILNIGNFVMLYESDGLGESINHPHSWLSDTFGSLILK